MKNKPKLKIYLDTSVISAYFDSRQHFWNLKIRPSIKKEFPADPMMQELHEFRARYPIRSQKDVIEMQQKIRASLSQDGFQLVETRPGILKIISQKD